MISGELQSWLKDLRKCSLGDVHPSLACKSKISALLRKEQLLAFPQGLHLAGTYYLCILDASNMYLGLHREMCIQEKDKQQQYIQKVYFDGVNVLIICYFRELLLLILHQKSIQVDMSFKRIAGDINEVLFATYIEEFQSGKYSPIHIGNTSNTFSNHIRKSLYE